MSNPHTLCPICHTLNRADARFCQKCGNNIWLNDKYRIVRAIKEGGMGAVYEAVDGQGKRYALKALIDRFTDPGERQEAIARFREEAELLEGLNHPRIPRVYDHFEHGGRYYLSMDFVDGIDLEDLQKQQPHERFSEPQVLYWADQIADVLDYLHSRRLIYRDVKPSNIMIENASGAIKVVDFGIAKLFQPHQRGTLIGTPGYSPPEQYQGQAEPRSDVFALGATLHHLLTGRDPRDNPPFSFPKVRNLVPSVSPETDSAIMKALEMELDQRWQSAAAFQAALPMELALSKQRSKSKPQATVLLDNAGQAAKPAVSPQAQQGQARKKQPAKPKTPKQPQPAKPSKPAQAAQAAPSRKRAWWPVWVFLTVLILIALGTPMVSDRLTALFNGADGATNVPAATATQAGVRRTIEYRIEVQATVPTGSDTIAIREGLVQSYMNQMQQEFGPEARILQSSPLSVVGSINLVSETETEQTYSATMNSYISYIDRSVDQ